MDKEWKGTYLFIPYSVCSANHTIRTRSSQTQSAGESGKASWLTWWPPLQGGVPGRWNAQGKRNGRGEQGIFQHLPACVLPTQSPWSDPEFSVWGWAPWRLRWGTPQGAASGVFHWWGGSEALSDGGHSWEAWWWQSPVQHSTTGEKKKKHFKVGRQNSSSACSMDTF